MALKVDKKELPEQFVTVSEDFLDNLIKKANEADFYHGKALGMEYVIDALADSIKGIKGE